ncbi:MAG: substrate-binding domain-containing protein, partial [Anaerolineae bacterium]|nr:substrate-binding domain-containing protein [Anaerolineae bacterium]
RQRVLAVAKKLGYSKTGNGILLQNPSISTIGLLTRSDPDGGSMLTNTFFSQIIVNIERECQRNNLNLMYANIEVDENGHTNNMPPMLLDELVDGVIVVGAFIEDTITDIYRRAGNNIVLIDGYTAAEIAFDSILIDNRQGAALATEHLIKNGHRKIGLIGSNINDYPSIAQRREGYLQTLARHGIHESYIGESNLLVHTGYEATLRLMKKHPEITAIFACNDVTAVNAVIAALRELGYRVPDDISVIGFDDTDIASQSNPTLTTIRVDRELMGILGVQRLIEQSKNPERSPIKTLISTQLIERHSVKRLVD